MVKKQNFIFISLILLFTSCDPPHDLIFINNSQSVATIKIDIDQTNEFNKFKYFDELKSDSLIYKIKPKDTTTIFFGIGTWSDREIRELANSITKLEIENSDFKTIYKSNNAIKKLLMDNRDDKIGWETEIIIEIK